MTDAPGDFDIREQIAHIDQMQADAARKRQEIQLAPWRIAAFAGMGAGAAMFAAGAAFIKFLG